MSLTPAKLSLSSPPPPGCPYTPALSLSHTQIQSYSLSFSSLSHARTLPLTHSLILSPNHTGTLCHRCTHSYRSPSLSSSVSLTHAHTLSLHFSLSFSFSLSVSVSYPLSHTYTLTHTHFPLFLSPTPIHTCPICCTCAQIFYPLNLSFPNPLSDTNIFAFSHTITRVCSLTITCCLSQKAPHTFYCYSLPSSHCPLNVSFSLSLPHTHNLDPPVLSLTHTHTLLSLSQNCV